jgi:uncharacterized protein
MIRLFFLCSILLLSGRNIYSQDNVADISLATVPDSVNKNNFTVFINIDIKKGWHLNSNKPLDDYLTPTKVYLKDTTGIRIVKIEYPPEMITKLQFSDSDLSLYEGMVTIKVNIAASDIFLKENRKAELDLDYQSCNNQTCLFPVHKILQADF